MEELFQKTVMVRINNGYAQVTIPKLCYQDILGVFCNYFKDVTFIDWETIQKYPTNYNSIAQIPFDHGQLMEVCRGAIRGITGEDSESYDVFHWLLWLLNSLQFTYLDYQEKECTVKYTVFDLGENEEIGDRFCIIYDRIITGC